MANKKKISIVFDRKKEDRTYPVSGVYGGITPSMPHNLVCHFFIDYNAIPNITEMEIDESGRVVDPTKASNISRGDITREVVTSIALPPETAISIGNWLIKNGEDALKNNSKKK